MEGVGVKRTGEGWDASGVEAVEGRKKGKMGRDRRAREGSGAGSGGVAARAAAVAREEALFEAGEGVKEAEQRSDGMMMALPLRPRMGKEEGWKDVEME